MYIYLFSERAPILGQNLEALGGGLFGLALGPALVIAHTVENKY